jgi:hypothetical protein
MIDFNTGKKSETSELVVALIKLVTLIGIILLQTFIIYYCWNDYLVGAINGINEIGFFQAMVLKVLLATLTSKDINFEVKK